MEEDLSERHFTKQPLDQCKRGARVDKGHLPEVFWNVRDTLSFNRQ